MDNFNIERPLVSFVVLAYNQERFVKEAVEAALAQTYQPLEIILSDDCSADKTFAMMCDVVEGYKGPHKIILNRNQKNLGLGAHVDRVAAMAKGDYLVLAGGDDVSVPERVNRSMEIIFRNGELGGVFGMYHEFSGTFQDSGNWKPRTFKEDHVVAGGPNQWIRRSKKGRFVVGPGCTAMWNKKLFTDFPPIPEGVMVEDIILGYRALISGMGVGAVSSGMVYYRVHGSNICAGVDRPIFAQRSLFAKAVLVRDVLYLKKKSPELYSEHDWNRILFTAKTMLYRAVVLSRTEHLGKFITRLLLLLGLKSAVSEDAPK
ncbi:glycosyltransferase [Tichowtungia aerotolerans]|uniref:Glycosyltransferase n=1 Tax=Tichowtungia aerotolerans TaxID=2697043 RepID=A0A6P1M506_9BACT|nr:glycosyltransferase [Tichowtungia aerotolerans]QHI68083.1 glycosyltransferase [Tichowtungia aerotolerans]